MMKNVKNPRFANHTAKAVPLKPSQNCSPILPNLSRKG